MAVAKRGEIERLVACLVERFHPQKVILFGSYAYGEPTEDSDLDFLVLASDPPPRHEAWRVASELRHAGGPPIQVVLMRPEEFDETKDVVGGLAYPAHNWGSVLYAAHA